ncbi:MAG: hypothetical protein Q8J66_09055 [Methylotenera sp.]|nr:hypothetical protein [Methylotenera sp.]
MEDIVEFLEQLQDWHLHKIENLSAVIESIKDGVILKIAEDGEQVELNAEQAFWFKNGLALGLSEFEKLPFTLTKNTEDDNQEIE